MQERIYNVEIQSSGASRYARLIFSYDNGYRLKVVDIEQSLDVIFDVDGHSCESCLFQYIKSLGQNINLVYSHLVLCRIDGTCKLVTLSEMICLCPDEYPVEGICHRLVFHNTEKQVEPTSSLYIEGVLRQAYRQGIHVMCCSTCHLSNMSCYGDADSRFSLFCLKNAPQYLRDNLYPTSDDLEQVGYKDVDSFYWCPDYAIAEWCK
jgi:hypothetical protein